MNAFRLPFVGFAARISVGLAALSTLHSAMATDEYVVYGKRAPVIHEIDRAALRSELEQRPAAVAPDAIADSVRAALADALRSERRSARAALREQRRTPARLSDAASRRRPMPTAARTENSAANLQTIYTAARRDLLA